MKITSVLKLIAVASISMHLSALASAQSSQGQSQSPQQAPAQTTQVELDDATLGQFVTALGSVSEIQVEYSELIGSTQDQAEAQNLQQEAQQKMVEAVEASGLDVQTYNMIAQQVAENPELEERIQQMLQS